MPCPAAVPLSQRSQALVCGTGVGGLANLCWVSPSLLTKAFSVPDGLAKKFGLTPEQFGENLRDSYQRHETEQFPAEPLELAKDYVCRSAQGHLCAGLFRDVAGRGVRIHIASCILTSLFCSFQSIPKPRGRAGRGPLHGGSADRPGATGQAGSEADFPGKGQNQHCTNQEREKGKDRSTEQAGALKGASTWA